MQVSKGKSKYAIKHLFENIPDLEVLGPIPAQVFINKKYRFRLLIKASKPLAIQNLLNRQRFSLREGKS